MPTTLHASAFAYCGAGCLLLGPSGSGKSRIVAEALVHGASLIADDQVALDVCDGAVRASPAATLSGVLELHGLGIVRMPFISAHPVHLVAMLGAESGERLPEPLTHRLEGIELPCIHLPPRPARSVPALLLFMKAVQEKRNLPTDWRPQA